MTQASQVTVLMSVHNGERFLAQALESVLAQTFRDFEFLIIDDCSTDSSLQILEEFSTKDERIRILRNKTNLGLTRSLNLGLREAHAPLIARMDADDIVTPDRLEKQVAFLEAHVDIGVVGSWMVCIDEEGNTTSGTIQFPVDSTEIVKILRENSGSSLAHPAVMIRKKILFECGGYRELFARSQDYDLWLRLADRGDVFANIPETFLLHRVHAGAISIRLSVDQAQSALLAWYEAKCRQRGVPDYAETLNALPEIAEMAESIASDFPEGVPMLLSYADSLDRSDFLTACGGTG